MMYPTVPPSPSMDAVARPAYLRPIWVAVLTACLFAFEPQAPRSWGLASGGQDEGKAAEAWPVKFSDDMQFDRRDAYGRSGDVTWERGALILKAGSIAWPRLTPGPRLELRARLDFEGPEAPGTGLRTEFHVPIRNAEAIVARLDQGRPIAGSGEITILHMKREDGASKETVLGRYAVEGGLKSGEWEFTYCYGLMQVGFGRKTLASGYTRHVKSVPGVMCFQQVGSVAIRRIDLQAVARPPTNYTEAQQKTFEAASAAYSRANEAFEGEDMTVVAREAQRAYEGFRSVVGERHPYTIMAMARLGHAESQAPGRSAEARDLLDRTLRLAREVYGPSHPEVADVLTRIAGARLVSNDSLGALRAYDQAERMLEETEGPTSLTRGVILIQAGYAALEGGRNPEAKRRFGDALVVLESAVGPDHVATADAHCELGSLLSRERRFDEASRHLNLALGIYSAVKPTSRETFGARFRLAELELARGRKPEAEAQFRLALAIAEDAFGPKSEAVAGSLGMLGTVAVERGRPDEALPLLIRMVEITAQLRGPDDVHTALAQGWLAALHHVRGDFATAAPLLQRAFDIELRAASEILPALSEGEALEFVQGVYLARDMMVTNSRRMPGVSAADLYRSIWRSRSLVTRLVGLRRSGPVDGPGQRDDLEALEAVRHQVARLTLAATRDADGDRNRQLDRLSEQKEELERRLQGRMPWLAQQRRESGVDYVEVARKLPPRTAVVDIVRATVRDNGLTLYDAFLLTPGGADEPCRVAWVPLGHAGPIDRAARAWRQRIAAGRGLVPEPEPGQPADGEAPEWLLRRLLWEKLEPHLTGVEHVILIPDGATTRIPWGALPGRAPGRVLLEDFAFSTVSHGQRLDQLLATGASPSKEDDRALLVGAIAYGEPVGDGPAARQSRPGWAYLPATLDEIDGIARLWRDRGTLARLSGGEASEAALRRLMPRSRFIHLATHGFFDDRAAPPDAVEVASSMVPPSWNLNLGVRVARGQVRNPLALSGVVLSDANALAGRGDDGSPADDGILTGEEVVGLDLSGTELVVLSACETGLGDTAGGEGVFGLQRSFELAGASTCIASQWKIPDVASMALMTRFYQNMWEKSMGKLAALREAQLWLRREGASRPDLVPGGRTATGDRDQARAGRLPSYYWAGFMLSGDWR